MELLVSVLAYQRARDEGRKSPSQQDFDWAVDNISYFEKNKCELGFCERNNLEEDLTL